MTPNPLQEYRNLLSTQFSGLKLSVPLFYKWDIGLRFDLQTDSESTVQPDMTEYFEFAHNRSINIFQELFDAEDDVFLVLHQYKWHKRKKIRKGNYVLKQISNISHSDVSFKTRRNLYDPEDHEDIWNEAIVKTKAKHIDHNNLLLAVTHTDFPSRKPHTSLRIYVVNSTKTLIFHQYDDRGLDVIASKTESLRPIYNKYSKWLLEYDRKLMGQRME